MNISIFAEKIIKKLKYHHLLDWMPDKLYLKLIYWSCMHRKLNLANPRTFNEKLQWLKLYDRRSEYTMMVDKYKVREYVKEQLGEEYLIPLLGVWDDPDEIDFDALPDQFVLKCNHNSGLGMCICKDKSRLDIPKVKAELRNGLAQDYYLSGREWPYKDVPRKIICEKFMTDESGELQDYKVHNFEGVPKVILVCSQRFSDKGLREDFYNTSWEKLDLKRPTHPQSENGKVQPIELEKMLDFSARLSGKIPFARTDFYSINGKLYFGEITFFPASGLEKFEPDEWDSKMGDWIMLPADKKAGGGYTLRNGNVCIWIHKESAMADYVILNKGLNDYKLMCFNGKVEYSFVCSDRFSDDGLKVTFFDRNWKMMDFERHYPKSKTPIPKPKNYEKMIEFSERLSNNIPFVRVDFYEINGKLYFGELTFFPGSGLEEFSPEEWDYKLGSEIKLPKKLKQE